MHAGSMTNLPRPLPSRTATHKVFGTKSRAVLRAQRKDITLGSAKPIDVDQVKIPIHTTGARNPKAQKNALARTALHIFTPALTVFTQRALSFFCKGACP